MLLLTLYPRSNALALVPPGDILLFGKSQKRRLNWKTLGSREGQ